MFVELVTFLDDNRDGGGGDILTLLHRVIKEPPTKKEIKLPTSLISLYF